MSTKEKGVTLLSNMTDEEKAEFERLLELAKRPMQTEPTNGGGSVADFFTALADVGEDYEPHIVVPFMTRKNDTNLNRR